MTKQNYEELNALLNQYGGDDACSLKVIAFPSGQFHNQEPDKPEELLEILKFVRPGKGFIPIMDFSTKVDVNGKEESPIFSWLKDMCPRPSDIISGDGDINWKPLKVSDVRWNFEKFLIDHHGKAVRRYLHFTMPMEMKIEIQAALKNCSDEQRGSAGQILDTPSKNTEQNDTDKNTSLKNTDTNTDQNSTSIYKEQNTKDANTTKDKEVISKGVKSGMEKNELMVEETTDEKKGEQSKLMTLKPTDQSFLITPIQNQYPGMKQGQIQNNMNQSEKGIQQKRKRWIKKQYTNRLHNNRQENLNENHNNQ